MSSPGKYRLGTIAVTTMLIELVAWGLFLTVWWLLRREVPAFRFAKPEVLPVLFAGPAMLVIFLLDLGRRNRALGRFASSAMLARSVPGISSTRVGARFLLLRHGLALVVIAAAGPQFGQHIEEVKADGIDLVVAVDVSNSMACEDLRPNRMETARRAMAQLIDKLRGDRLGIVVFAGEAFVQLPITSDRSAAKLFLGTVDMNTVGTQGTAIGTAIELAQQSFDPKSVASKAIIVITDGENHEDDAEGAARKAAEAGITVYTVGMGTARGGPLPVRRNGQVVGFRKDRDGNNVVSRLDPEMLRRIAAAGKGKMVMATERSTGIEGIVEELKNMDRSESGTYRFAAHEDHYQYPLGAGALLIALGLAFGDRRQPDRKWSPLNA